MSEEKITKEEHIQFLAEDMMFDLKRPCLTPVEIKLPFGGNTQHCCWNCHNCKTAKAQVERIQSRLLSAQLATIAKAVERLIFHEWGWVCTCEYAPEACMAHAFLLKAIEEAGKK